SRLQRSRVGAEVHRAQLALAERVGDQPRSPAESASWRRQRESPRRRAGDRRPHELVRLRRRGPTGPRPAELTSLPFHGPTRARARVGPLPSKLPSSPRFAADRTPTLADARARDGHALRSARRVIGRGAAVVRVAIRYLVACVVAASSIGAYAPRAAA